MALKYTLAELNRLSNMARELGFEVNQEQQRAGIAALLLPFAA